MAPMTHARHHAAMRNISGLARLGIGGLALAGAAVTTGFLVPGELGALLRGYGAMLLPAVTWLFAGVAVRHIVSRRHAEARTPSRVMLSARDGSLRP
jgi:hypothetical protein